MLILCSMHTNWQLLDALLENPVALKLLVWSMGRCHAESPSWTVQRLRNMICTGPKEYGAGEERRSRPSRVALNHVTKDLNSTMYTLSGSAPGHMMLLPPIHIPQASLPLCSNPLILTQTQSGSCCVGNTRPLAGQPAPLRSAPGSREEGLCGLPRPTEFCGWNRVRTSFPPS